MALFEKKMRDPVTGTAEVVTVGLSSSGGGSQRCAMDLMVQAAGVAAHLVHVTKWVSTGKWPAENQVLPVLVDRADPERVKVLWDEVPSLQDKFEAREAERLQAAQRRQASGSTVLTARGESPPGTDLPRAVAFQAAPGSGSAADVLAQGAACRAVIDQSQDMGLRNPDGVPMCAFTLTVSGDGTAPYQIQVANPVPPERQSLVFPGSDLPAKVLTDNPNAVVIDWATAVAELAR